jgi:hypothetical protein
MWGLCNSEIPEDAFVCHHCDNPACVNPDHLFLGFQKENMEDMHSKKRGAVGEKHGLHKLTLEEVSSILTEYIPHVVTQYQLAKKYGVTRACIAAITQERTWSRALKQSS